MQIIIFHVMHSTLVRTISTRVVTIKGQLFSIDSINDIICQRFCFLYLWSGVTHCCLMQSGIDGHIVLELCVPPRLSVSLDRETLWHATAALKTLRTLTVRWPLPVSYHMQKSFNGTMNEWDAGSWCSDSTPGIRWRPAVRSDTLFKAVNQT